jgi:hypothetical protein
MVNNLTTDDALVDEAQRVGKHATKNEAVTQALQEHAARQKQLAIIELFGMIDSDSSYSIRESRNLDNVEVNRESPRR